MQRLDCALGTDPDLPLDSLLNDLDADAVLVMRAGSETHFHYERRWSLNSFKAIVRTSIGDAEVRRPLRREVRWRSHRMSPIRLWGALLKEHYLSNATPKPRSVSFCAAKCSQKTFFSNYSIMCGNPSLHNSSSTKGDYGATADAQDHLYTNRSAWRRYTHWSEQAISALC